MNTYWWFRPSRIALLVILPITCGAFWAPRDFYRQFKAFNAITSDDFFLLWISILGFAGASWLGEVLFFSNRSSRLPYVREANYRVLLLSLTFVAAMATFVFLSPFFMHPQFILSVFRGDPGAIYVVEGYANQISGITSLENLFSLVVVLFMVKSKLTGRPQGRWEKGALALILVVSAFKAVMHGERLALIELVVPICIVGIALRPRSFLWVLAPLAGIVALILFFAGTEYLRSWVAYYSQQSDSLMDFVLDRILAYYLTSINNGAFIYGSAHAYFFPVFTGEWLWHLPIPHLRDFLTSATGADTNVLELLSRGQNVEFNDTSGIFAPLIDFGPVLGTCTWIALGFLSGRLYRAFLEGHYLGLILFPTWYVGLLEIPRVFYWGDNRYFPTLVCSLVITLAFLLLPPPARSPELGRRRLAALSNPWLAKVSNEPAPQD